MFYTQNLVRNILAIKVHGNRVTDLVSLKILPYYLQSPTIWNQEVNTWSCINFFMLHELS